MILLNGASRVSSQKWKDQPPNGKLPLSSSSGPPGACMTPSSEEKTAPVSLRIDILSAQRGFDFRDVDLAHRHHRLERPLGRGLVGVGVGFEQYARRDLPGKAPAVLAPAAGAFFTAVGRDRVPVAVGFRLVLGDDHEAHRLVRLEIRSAVQAHEVAPEESKADGEFGTLLAAGK